MPYAWHFFVNILTSDEITATEAVDHFAGGHVVSGKVLSSVTLRQHFEIFVRTYVEGEVAGPRSTPEETLDSPLTSLGLMKDYGERKLPSGKREVVYRFRSGPKPSLSSRTFRYCLHEWWNRAHQGDSWLTIRQIAHGSDSPGRCFRLPENEIHKVLSELTKEFPKEIELFESQNQHAVRRKLSPDAATLLQKIYRA